MKNHHYFLCENCLKKAKEKGIIIKAKKIKPAFFDSDWCCISCLDNDPFSVNMYDVEATEIFQDND